ncbi:MAG: c-type cytochrome [Gammaproteobacteria bacterium]
MRRLAIISVWILTGISYLHATELPSPGLGRPAVAEEITAQDWGVMPDGTGLPAGAGSVRQGEAVYATHCSNCHGVGGLGDSADQLAGAIMHLTDEWPEKTVGTYWPYATTLFDFIRRSMPMLTPGSLSNAEVYAVTAYILYLNHIVAEDTVLDAQGLQSIKMPNRDGFIIHGE